MRVKCISVRLEALSGISDRAYKATAYDGSTAIIPKSQVYGRDWDVVKSEAYWISEWILEKKELQHSNKKIAWFDSNTRKMIPSFTVIKHTPEKKKPVIENTITGLKKQNDA